MTSPPFPAKSNCKETSKTPRQEDILAYLFEYTKIPQTLSDRETIDYRYIVDSYAGCISSSSKYST